MRERFIGESLQERIVVHNVSSRPVALEVELELGADFADIFAVKDRDFALGDPLRAAPLPPLAPCSLSPDGRVFTLRDEGSPARTEITLSAPCELRDGCAAYRVELEPRSEWSLRFDVVARPGGGDGAPRNVDRHFGEEVTRVRNSLQAWHVRVPQLRTSWDILAHTFSQSVADLAALRIRAGEGLDSVPAAGMPWFMTVFGRDTIITSLQTLLFGSELAVGALRVLARLQAREDDPTIDAEPGKIVHEVRHGKGALAWYPAYYGTVDATPLWLILLSEVWRWTSDDALVHELREPALRALEWIDRWGDRDGDGFVEYERRSPKGLVNQSWKDSGDSQRFADGTIARGPIAPCEVQGYVYDAKRRLAELARDVWRDRPLADRLDAEAAELQRRFDEAFWVDAGGGYYALALDGDKRRVDSLCSNAGHLLWSGIVPDERADALVDALLGDVLWSGWGVRTMSTADGGYNPLSYHNGTVWPHDNSLIAWGLARYGRWPEALRLVRGLFAAAEHFDYQLPEVFAGWPRSETPFPIAYPTAARPQAWAAGTPVLLLQLLLGVQPDGRTHALVSHAPPSVPNWAGTIRLSGVRAFDRLWNVRLDGGAVEVAEL